MILKNEETMKGIEFSVKTISVIALGIMVVVLLYVSFESWFTHVMDEFLEGLVFQPED